MSSSFRGYTLGIISAMCYGLNPLFAIPLYSNGMNVDSVLFLRFLISAIIIALLMRIKKLSFRVERDEIIPLIAMGLLMALSSLFLFNSYKHIAVGIASTLLFVYPAMVAIINSAIFKEKTSLIVVVSILVAALGIILLSWTKENGFISLLGITFVMLSALSYAIYLVAINHSTVKTFPVMKLTFYVLAIGAIVFLSRIIFSSDLKVPSNLISWLNIGGLAFFPTVVSLTAMSFAVRNIGSTSTAILGALEPLTGVMVGILVFGELFTSRITVGIILIILAITAIITEKPLRKTISHIPHKI